MELFRYEAYMPFDLTEYRGKRFGIFNIPEKEMNTWLNEDKELADAYKRLDSSLPAPMIADIEIISFFTEKGQDLYEPMVLELTKCLSNYGVIAVKSEYMKPDAIPLYQDEYQVIYIKSHWDKAFIKYMQDKKPAECRKIT